MAAAPGDAAGSALGGVEARAQYANKVELILSLVGYAVGFGNVWRFPFLVFSYGGGAFLLPYLLSLALLGVPLFILEMGLGQMFRQSTLGVWHKLELPRLRGVGAAATVCTFLVVLYYNVIVAWTLYYLGRTIYEAFTSGELPWALADTPCADKLLIVRRGLASSPFILDGTTGLFNRSHIGDFWCPAVGVPHSAAEAPEGFTAVWSRPLSCPGESAVRFWQDQVLRQSSGMDDVGGVHAGMLVAFTVAWVLVYLSMVNGIRTSGKVVYVTAILPYFALVALFIRALTLENASTGVKFLLEPDFSQLTDSTVWGRAASQIFYSLGVGFGAVTAFASYADRRGDYVRDATAVALINCGTSVFAAFAVFPVLGYLAHELSNVSPCIQSDNLNDLSHIGLQGTGLTFIAFPIAISRMPGAFFWAITFFVMLLCIGITSQFAMTESVATVLSDAGVGGSWPRPVLNAVVCIVSYLLGLIFITRGGIYWFRFFDQYVTMPGLFIATGLECVGVMWMRRSAWLKLSRLTKEWTGRRLGCYLQAVWGVLAPLLMVVMIVLTAMNTDPLDTKNSTRFPGGAGYYPGWSRWLGWVVGLLPVLALCIFSALPIPPPARPSPVDLDGAPGANDKAIVAEPNQEADFEVGTSAQASGDVAADRE